MKLKILLALSLAALAVIFGVAFGSVYIPAGDVLRILANRIFGAFLSESVANTSVSIVWNLRLPRVLLAFLVGGALSVSGAVMQSVLRNPLASSYTLGVSSGASLGAALVILLGVSFPFLGTASLPVMGFVFGLGTILIAIVFASRIDGMLENNTIILTGMVISLFTNAVVTLLTSMSGESAQRLIFWQMGSFALKDWNTVLAVLPVSLIGTVITMKFNRELDLMTFGEEQAKVMGVDIKRIKWILIIIAAAMTGSAVSFVGVIGFVDLVVPHIVRKIFGSRHRYIIPMSAVLGGVFMVACDLIARTVVPKQELSVGAVTAMIGAPVFAWIFFRRRNQ